MDLADLQILLSQVEGTHLDFKRQQYDSSDKGNVELAKDIMAMANALKADDPAAFILVGVDEDAITKRGIIASAQPQHFDDATFHQKIASYLNKVPRFSYLQIPTNTISVGAFMIRPGGRPYYAIKDKSPLRRNVAFVRDGTTYVEATPDLVGVWKDEDDAEARELRRLQLARAREENTPEFALSYAGHSMAPDRYTPKFQLANRGTGRFDFSAGTALWSFDANIATAPGAPPPPPLSTPAVLQRSEDHRLLPQETRYVVTTITTEQISRHLAQALINGVLPAEVGQYIRGKICITCATATGPFVAELEFDCQKTTFNQST